MNRLAILSVMMLAAGVCISIGHISEVSAATTRVSVSSAGVQGNASSGGYPGSSISADGSHVCFASSASNLVVDDTNGNVDVFVHDRILGVTERVSVSSGGVEGNNRSFYCSMSADGRFVVFASSATNLIEPSPGGDRIYLRDRQAGTTTLIGDGNRHGTNPVISADGKFVAYESTMHDGESVGIILFKRETSEMVLIAGGEATVGCGDFCRSSSPSISADGKRIAFESKASHLVAGDTNSTDDVFVYDYDAATIERVSVNSEGHEGYRRSFSPSISADGRFVAFSSEAPNLVDGDTNWQRDVFVHDRLTSQTFRVSVDSLGVEAPIRDGSWGAVDSAISANGRYVAFSSDGWDYYINRQIYLRDMRTGITIKLSLTPTGGATKSESVSPSISADGGYVSFNSGGSEIVNGDTNGANDVFLRETAISPNNSPVSGDQNVVATAGMALPIDLFATDIDQDPLRYQVVVSPVHGILSGAPPKIVYLPNVGFTGTDHFSYIATDGLADSNLGTVHIMIQPSVPLSAALDIQSSWQSGGTLPWIGQSSYSHDGIDAAMAGLVSASQSSWLKTTITGPKVVTFWWMLPDSVGAELVFLVDSRKKAAAPPGGGWRKMSFEVKEGKHEIKWKYSRSEAAADVGAAAVVDQVKFMPISR